jgi:hypothetical protein
MDKNVNVEICLLVEKVHDTSSGLKYILCVLEVPYYKLEKT